MRDPNHSNNILDRCRGRGRRTISCRDKDECEGMGRSNVCGRSSGKAVWVGIGVKAEGQIDIRGWRRYSYSPRFTSLRFSSPW